MPKLNPDGASKRAAILATIPPNPPAAFQMTPPQFAALLGISAQTMKRMRIPWTYIGVQKRLSYGLAREMLKNGIRTYPYGFEEAAE